MNGLKFAANGFAGRAPTMSGYSCGGFALSIVDIWERFQKPVEKPKKIMLISPRRGVRRVASSFQKGEGES